jgi:hypothetical protein
MPVPVCAGRLHVCCPVPISVMEADAAFVAHIRAANDLLGARQLAACEALLDWAGRNCATGTSAHPSKLGKRAAGSIRSVERDQFGALRQQTLAKWGLVAFDDSLSQF